MGSPYLGERDSSVKGLHRVSESSEALAKSGGRLLIRGFLFFEIQM